MASSAPTILTEWRRMSFQRLELKLLELEVGQALGLLVLLRFTHYCAST